MVQVGATCPSNIRCTVPSPSLRPAVYIGDSMTDIPPLISADAGILVGSNDLVRQVAAVAGEQLGVSPG